MLLASVRDRQIADREQARMCMGLKVRVLEKSIQIDTVVYSKIQLDAAGKLNKNDLNGAAPVHNDF